MTYAEAAKIGETVLLPRVSVLYALDGYEIRQVSAHKGGRNVVYACEKEGADAKIVRISFLPDRSREDILAEVEYVRYLSDHGGSVSNVLCSAKGNLLEEVPYGGHVFFVCAFEKAKGRSLAENHYRYREGAPLTEYFFNCGKTLGKLHQLSKEYAPVHLRYSFFDKYNAAYLEKRIPGSLPLLKKKLTELLKKLERMDKDRETFGMVHFDYSDGNYMIDFDTGKIMVYDFDNACMCWYMYDIANLWVHGVGWIMHEQDAAKRREFMDGYFASVIEGYETETQIDRAALDQLPLFIQTVLMENIVDAFETMLYGGGEPECDEDLSYHIKCMEDDIPYMGFFHEIYSPEAPFEYEGRDI